MGSLLDERVGSRKKSSSADTEQVKDNGKESAGKKDKQPLEAESRKAVKEREKSRRQEKKEREKEEKKVREEAAGKEPSVLEDESYLDQEALDFDREMQQILSKTQERKSNRRIKRARIILTAFFSIACIYLVSLIYGVVITDFQYGQEGKPEPIVLSVKEIAAQADYTKTLAAYLKAREIYEHVLTLDFRLSSNQESLMAVAPEYQKVLDEEISPLITQIQGMDQSSTYSQVLGMILSWLGAIDSSGYQNPYALAIYCGKVNIAISQQDAQAEEDASIARQEVESMFRLITENIVTLGSNIKGIDISGLATWSPESYIENTYILGES